MRTTSQALGVLGEELAFNFLTLKGYKILTKNYECTLGEIDLIAKHKGDLVFIEVKTRSSELMGVPAESVTLEKQKQITKTALHYLKRYGLCEVPCRFDVVSVLFRGKQYPVIELIENAFGGG